MLKKLRLPRSLQGPWHQTHPNQALHAQDQRQGRTLHPDQLARMGLRPRIPNLRAPKTVARSLAAQLQLASTTRQHTIHATHQSPQSNHEQPVEAPQLAAAADIYRTVAAASKVC